MSPGAPERGTASSTASSSSSSSSLLGSLSANERRFVLQQRAIQMLNSFMHIISTTAHYQSYLEQVNGDVARLALHYGRTMSINNACNTFLAPVVGSLSDACGRRTLHWLGRAGAAIFFMLMPLNHMRFLANPGNATIQESVLRSRMAIEILGFGILSAGNWGVFAAAHTDLFADRPSLSSRLQAADQMWRDAVSGPASLAAAFLTPILWGKSYWWVLYAASAALGLAQLVVALMMRETLPEGRKRQKFSLRRANPLANVALLFRRDAGLRSLAAACSCYFLCQSNWSIAASYRMGVLGWSPAQSSYFNTVSQFLSSLSARGLVLPFMARRGNRKAFENGCLIATLAYIGCALSWLPQDVGGSKLRHAMQYGGSVILLQAWPAACLHSIRALIVKQGIEVTTAGKGELNAAISGLGSLAGIIGPGLLWGPLFKMCTSGGEHGSSVTRRLGKGGHYVGCCCFMLAASLILRLTPNRFLFIDEARHRSSVSQQQSEKAAE